MSRLVYLAKTEPALVVGVVQAVLALLGGTVLHLSVAETGAILAATTAVLALLAAVYTHPFQVSALTGLTGAVVTLLIAFGVHGVQPGIVSTVNAAVVAIAALLVRVHVTPVANIPQPQQPAPVARARTPPAAA